MPAKRVPPRTMPDRWEESADVVVVGYGYAGAVAAIEAHDAGASVLILEKMPDPGGISITSGGNVRIVDDAEQGFQHLKATNDGTTPDSVLHALAVGMQQMPAYFDKIAKADAAPSSTGGRRTATTRSRGPRRSATSVSRRSPGSTQPRPTRSYRVMCRSTARPVCGCSA